MRIFLVLVLVLCSTNSFAKLINWEYSDFSGSITSKGQIRYDSSPDHLRQFNIDGHDLIDAQWLLDNVKTPFGPPVPGFKTAKLYIISISLESVEWGINFRLDNGLLGWNQAALFVPKEYYITSKDPLGAAFDAGWAPSVRIFDSDREEFVGKFRFHSVKVFEPVALTLMLLGLLMLSVSRVTSRIQSFTLKT